MLRTSRYSSARCAPAVAAACLASLVVIVPAAQAQDIGFCASPKVVAAMRNVGPVGSMKPFDDHGGVWCQYGGTHGSFVEKLPHVTTAAFGQSKASMQGKTLAGLGVPAFSTAGSLPGVYALKGSTEIHVGAKATPAKLMAAVKAILALVH